MNATHRGDRASGDRAPVAIAAYHYRHEAEFAAGFLKGARIPFRLQIDDAGGADAGVTMGRPAVLWVRAEDEEEARAILGLDDSSAAISRTAGPGATTASHDPFVADDDPFVAGDDDDETGPADGARMTRSPADRTEGLTFEPLCQTERVVAAVLALGLFGLAAYGGEGAVPWVGVWESIALGAALALGLSAVSGQTLRPIKAILRALSGNLR